MEIISSPDSKKIVTYLTGILSSHLKKGEYVLWLVPGGSAIAVAAAVSKNLAKLDLSKLTVSLSDERYGELDHKNENWPQLFAAGFDLPGATLHRVLSGDSRSETTAQQASFLYEAMQINDFKIGLFGMGSDGHIAGIKPGTVAVTDHAFAESYVATDFERITITTYAITQLSEAVLYAYGPEKYEQIKKLQRESLSLEAQPAQVLKQVKKSTIFTDYRPA